MSNREALPHGFVKRALLAVFPETGDGFVRQVGDDILGVGSLSGELAMGSGGSQ